MGYQLPSYQRLFAFPYYGGKSRFAEEIAELLDHNCTTTYCEPFGGSAAVLLNKLPHEREIYADKSLALCCFWRSISESGTASEVIDRLCDMDYDREAFKRCRALVDEAEASGRGLNELSSDEITEIAAACFTVFTFSRDAAGLRFHDGREKKHEAYNKAMERLYEVAERVQGVEVVRGDALELLNKSQFDCTNTMIYLDPVYLPEKGRSKSRNHKLYRYHFSYEEHISLLERIRSMQCKILLSGYVDETRLYDRYLIEGEGADGTFKPWRRYEIETLSSVAKGDKVRVETLWRNYD